VVKTLANYFEPTSFRNCPFPWYYTDISADTLGLALAVSRLGKSSVTYRVGIFIHQDDKSKEPRDPRACVVVDFVHVFVDPTTRKSVPMPESTRAGFLRILREEDEKAKL